jgi:expansin (peptidoglycan-binding protein)
MFDNFPGANGNPNQNPICGKPAVITYNGKTITVAVTDRCEACGYADLDLSPKAFSDLTGGNMGIGRTGFSWHWA